MQVDPLWHHKERVFATELADRKAKLNKYIVADGATRLTSNSNLIISGENEYSKIASGYHIDNCIKSIA